MWCRSRVHQIQRLLHALHLQAAKEDNSQLVLKFGRTEAAEPSGRSKTLTCRHEATTATAAAISRFAAVAIISAPAATAAAIAAITTAVVTC